MTCTDSIYWRYYLRASSEALVQSYSPSGSVAPHARTLSSSERFARWATGTSSAAFVPPSKSIAAFVQWHYCWERETGSFSGSAWSVHEPRHGTRHHQPDAYLPHFGYQHRCYSLSSSSVHLGDHCTPTTEVWHLGIGDYVDLSPTFYPP